MLLFSCSSTKINDNGEKYFDQNNVQISKSKFDRKLSTYKFFEIPGDSTHHKKLTVRENRGKITNRSEIELLLENEIEGDVDSSKPLILIYYPGQDQCNSSGSATKESRREWDKDLEEGVEQIAQVKPIYIYKDNKGLYERNDPEKWHKDPKSVIEEQFFQYHYPCKSFVVISENGDYFSYFGEFGKDRVWKATKMMNR